MDGVTMAAYAQNGESIRIDQGYPVRIVAPGYTGRWLVKWMTQLYVTDDTHVTRQDGMNMEDRMPDGSGFLLATDLTRYYRLETTPRSVITFPSGGQRLRVPVSMRYVAWPGLLGPSSGWKSLPMAARTGRMPRCRNRCCPIVIPAFVWTGNGTVGNVSSSPAAPMRRVTSSLHPMKSPRPGAWIPARNVLM